MKRTQINGAIREMEQLINDCHFKLPPFCGYTPEEWRGKGHDHDEIRDNHLGWDITDYGLNDFESMGFSLITLRNGNPRDERNGKTYAEKLLMLKEGQRAPMHFHWHKMEDIINRGGGILRIRVYWADEAGSFRQDSVTVSCDGVRKTVPAGSVLSLGPGESITIPPGLYHDFSVAGGTGAVLIGEVSMVNDDAHDNRFKDSLPRFPAIEEDAPPYRLLCTEYPGADHL